MMNIYLSPHHDDICFSLGVLAARQGGEVVTAFTTSFYAVAGDRLPSDRRGRTTYVTELRRQENIRFTEAAGLGQHDLGLSDAPVLGIHPFDLDNMEEELEALRQRLIVLLDRLLPAGSTPATAALYCPMAIGKHRNHVALVIAVRRALGTLSRRCAIWLYEDLPYASEHAVRHYGIATIEKLFAGAVLHRQVIELNPDETRRKMDMIGLYASQHERAPRPETYTPSSGLCDAMHEIVYRCANPARA